VRETAPGARITLHGQADLWATGPSPAVTRSAAGDVDAILVPAWPSTPASYQSIEAARRLAPATVSVGAYVSVLAPTNLAAVDEHAAAVLAAGADELHLYHLGLANEQQLAAIGRLARLGG
jgi:hypothetical protein